MSPRYHRVLLKLSGEVLGGPAGTGFDPAVLNRLAEEIRAVRAQGVQLCLVIGGGNIFRGMAGFAGIERTTGDHIGMLATVMNALAMQAVLENMEVPTRVLSAIPIQTVCEPYIRRRAIRHLEKDRVVIFAAGTGNPYFTTDSAAALRASEMDCQVLLKGTKVDGVYDRDPSKFPDAKRFQTISHQEVLERDLRVMDGSAISLSREKGIPVLVFSIEEPGAMNEVISGRGRYTTIT